MNTSAFRTGDPVYIDFPFEDVMFRYEGGKVYRKFYGETQETEVPQPSELFCQAVLSGKQVSQGDYERKR